MAEEDVEVDLVLKDEFTKDLGKAEKAVKKFGKTAKKEAAKASQGFAKTGMTMGKMVAAGLGVDSVAAVLGRIAQASTFMTDTMETGFKAVGEYVDDLARDLGLLAQQDILRDAFKRRTAAAQDDLTKLSLKSQNLTRTLKDLRETYLNWVDAAVNQPGAPDKALREAGEAMGFTMQRLREEMKKLQQDQAAELFFKRMIVQARGSKTSVDLLTRAWNSLRKEITDAEAAARTAAAAQQALDKAFDDATTDLDLLREFDLAAMLRGWSIEMKAGRGEAAGLSEELLDLGLSHQQVGEAIRTAMGEQQLKQLETFMRASRKELGLTDTAIAALIARIRALRAEQSKEAEVALEASKRTFGAGFQSIREELNDLEGLGTEVAQGLAGAFQTFFFDIFNRDVDAGKALLKGLLDLALQILSRQIALSIVSGLGSVFGTPGRHTGGDVSPSRPVIVGERGPEVFRPRQPGDIVPIAQQPAPLTAGGGGGGEGGGGRDVNVHIMALDAVSFWDFAQKNKRVWRQLFKEALSEDHQMLQGIRRA